MRYPQHVTFLQTLTKQLQRRLHIAIRFYQATKHHLPDVRRTRLLVQISQRYHNDDDSFDTRLSKLDAVLRLEHRRVVQHGHHHGRKLALYAQIRSRRVCHLLQLDGLALSNDSVASTDDLSDV